MNGKSNYFIGVLSGIVGVMLLNFTLNSVAPTLRTISNLPASQATTKQDTTQKDLSSSEISQKTQDIYNILDRYYVDNYDKTQTIETMYQGLVYGVGDPYTSYLNKEAFAQMMEDTEGRYAGIGISVTVDEKNNLIEVISPFEGQPGILAGIMPGDKIMKINGHNVYGDTLQDAVKMMKGEPGTSVNITIYRESTDKIFDLDIVRKTIDVPTVSHKIINENIGYIRITSFDLVTYDQYMIAYNDLQKQNIKGLIVDLRNNPGGVLETVCKITDTLMPEGTIVYTEDKRGKKTFTNSDAKAFGKPILVLVNGGSASASEVLSGAVKDTGVAELVGTRTFGKGLVQGFYTMEDGSAVKVTIARYYTPSGVCIQGEGIPPNYEVDMSADLSVKISTLTLEEDVQLKKAVEVMAQKIK